jgi:hypothetical protein
MPITMTEYAMYGDMPNYVSQWARTDFKRTKSGRAYLCGSGEHRYHRDQHAAYACVDPSWTRPLTTEESRRDPSRNPFGRGLLDRFRAPQEAQG